VELKLNENTLEWVESVLVDCGELRAADVRELSDREWFGASIDSRGNCSRRLFVALAGDNTDGHRFVANAIDSGAAAVIVSEQKAADNARDLSAPVFVVKNTLLALQAIASAYRATLNMRVVAVTGSAGKTTTKEYIRAILKRKYRVHSSPGNYNNHIGVPLTLLETDPDCEYLVAEIGANHVGEIDFLSTMLRPDIGVVTNVGDAHIGLFGSRDRIAEAKAELFSGIDEEGYAVLPADDDYFDLLRGHCRCRVMSYGTAADARFRVPLLEVGAVLAAGIAAIHAVAVGSDALTLALVAGGLAPHFLLARETSTRSWMLAVAEIVGLGAVAMALPGPLGVLASLPLLALLAAPWPASVRPTLRRHARMAALALMARCLLPDVTSFPVADAWLNLRFGAMTACVFVGLFLVFRARRLATGLLASIVFAAAAYAEMSSWFVAVGAAIVAIGLSVAAARLGRSRDKPSEQIEQAEEESEEPDPIALDA